MRIITALFFLIVALLPIGAQAQLVAPRTESERTLIEETKRRLSPCITVEGVDPSLPVANSLSPDKEFLIAILPGADGHVLFDGISHALLIESSSKLAYVIREGFGIPRIVFGPLSLAFACQQSASTAPEPKEQQVLSETGSPMDQFEKALKAKPNDYKAHLLVAKTLEKLNRPNDAYPYHLKVIQLGGTSSEASYSAARVSEMRQECAENYLLPKNIVNTTIYTQPVSGVPQPVKIKFIDGTGAEQIIYFDNVCNIQISITRIYDRNVTNRKISAARGLYPFVNERGDNNFITKTEIGRMTDSISLVEGASWEMSFKRTSDARLGGTTSTDEQTCRVATTNVRYLQFDNNIDFICDGVLNGKLSSQSHWLYVIQLGLPLLLDFKPNKEAQPIVQAYNQLQVFYEASELQSEINAAAKLARLWNR